MYVTLTLKDGTKIDNLIPYGSYLTSVNRIDPSVFQNGNLDRVEWVADKPNGSVSGIAEHLILSNIHEENSRQYILLNPIGDIEKRLLDIESEIINIYELLIGGME